MRMTVVIVVVVMTVIIVIVVAMIVVIMVIVIVMVSMIVVIMVIVIVMVSMIVVIIVAVIVVVSMIVVIIMVSMIIVSMGMNNAVEVFRLSINNRGTDRTFNGEYTIVRKSPFEDVTELAVDSVVLGFAIEVGLETTMPLDRDHGSDTEFTGRDLFTTTVAAMGMNCTDCSIAGKQQAKSRRSIQERKTRKNHWIRKSEKCAVESAN